ncbi:hypothetical protein GEU84_019160 [Fertoebacter nigrum]|uniref:Sulfotransferase domain-containing protein n=1 Tax=Fertoeibacter niger TaxID=2656921 RepID=A0A8X8H505_9RHOB|nr:hypothetical protein [Fertoeibacter niger]NUB46517.1 hypothetical protein [Fertoeibacter niger]
MKKLYLHIGLQKTGTSTIQMYFMAPQGPLKAAKIDYLREAFAPRHAHHNAALEMSRNRRYDPALPGMDALLAAAHASRRDKLFVSSEDFSLLGRNDIKVLGQRLEPFSVQLILCLRNQLEWSESLFAQACKRGYTGSFTTFSDRLQADGKLDFLTLIQNWIAVFGQDNLSVMIYENHADISDALADLLGVTVDAPPARKNQSLNERFVTASQIMAEQCQNGQLRRGDAVIPAELQALVAKKLLALGAQHAPFAGSPVFLDADAAQAYLDRSRAVNTGISQIVPLPEAYFTLSPRRRAPKAPTAEDMEWLMDGLFGDPDIQAKLAGA